ncbi:MAG: molybdate ABC transporter permease subunit [Spirochaetota bacterium]
MTLNALEPIWFSIRVATMATVITLLVGLALARLFSQHRIRLGKLWETLILLPLVFPPTITGYILLLLLGRRGPIGAVLSKLELQVVFTWVAAVIASVTVSLPLMYQNCKAALAGIDPRYADVARTLGLDEERIWLRITIPLAAPGILGGIALSFARALGEFGATLMIAGNIPGRTQTVPLALYSAVEGGRTEEANLYLMVTVILSFAVIALVGLGERHSKALDGRSRFERSPAIQVEATRFGR